ncbi:MAG: DUF1566 domain-containing protein [Rudaea sp.]|uniref:Lcl domain-containing protein n=1 Tax=Rudaea sp. TaxID=2136325 RepID=UPI0039E598B8
MLPKSKIPCIVVLFVAASGPGRAQEVLPVDINDTGQTTCFVPSGDGVNGSVACTNAVAAGQDGATGRDATADLQKTRSGVAGFDFTPLDADGVPLAWTETVGNCERDNVTGLVWQTAVSDTVDYQVAYALATAANAAQLCGRTDWWLPITDDLLGLVDYGATSPAIDADHFPDTPGEFFWTADLGTGETAGRVWVVNFNDGFAHTVTLRERAHVRLVAGARSAGTVAPKGPIIGQPIALFSDVVARIGVSTAAADDTAASATVSDSRTGLMWDTCTLGETDADCEGTASLLDWADALAAVAAANAANWRGYSDWRLPNIKELDSLIDRGRDAPAIDTAAFPTAGTGIYWSSTTYENSAGMAWGMSNRHGYAFAWDKSTLARVRLVRTTAAGPSSYPLFTNRTIPAVDVLPVATATLPTIDIVTDGGAPIVSEDDYLSATMTITNVDGSVDYSGTLKIKGHGNTTWGMPKKPYRIKLDSKANLLGMNKSKNWILLANYDDKTLLRDALAPELGNRFGLAWSPASQFGELTLNGVYAGTYQLSEKVEVDDDRVDIDELDAEDTDADVITGGYLVEMDVRIDQAGDCDVSFRSVLLNTPFCIDSPDYAIPLVDAQYDYISGYVSDTENALYADSFADPDTGYAAWIDVDSYVNWYLVQELMKNMDAIGVADVFFYKPRGGKLFHGPLWDFDVSSGNSNYNSSYGAGPAPEGWWLRTNGFWTPRMFEDPAFAANTSARWQAIRSQLDTLPAWLDQMDDAFGDAPANNFVAWPILDSQVWPNGVVTGSHQGEVEFLKDWLRERIAWMDANIGADIAASSSTSQ